MRKIILIATAIAAFTAVAHADVVEDRKAIMKAIGKSVGSIAPMLKGEKPFDSAVAIDALSKISENANKFDVAALFPAGSDKGNTEASPKVWDEAADFSVHVEKFRTDAAAAAEAKPQDMDQLKVAFQQVSANCGTCHQAYRVKKD